VRLETFEVQPGDVTMRRPNFNLFDFLGCGETESKWYVGYYLDYCTALIDDSGCAEVGRMRIDRENHTPR
jgi:hypothetical protein